MVLLPLLLSKNIKSERNYNMAEKLKPKSKEHISIINENVLDTKKHNIELIADDEIFVSVRGMQNYWISNHGRLLNNLKGYWYIHRNNTNNPDRCTHYTLFDTSSETREKIEAYTDKLVAEHFLEKPSANQTKVWHIDRNKSNCFYKNLIWVTEFQYRKLRSGQSVELHQQKYIPFITLKGNKAYNIWNGIYKRCYCRDDIYEGAYMCDLWKNDIKAFVKWWNENYYEIPGETMAVDKDLLVPGNKEYAPDKCCILPQTLNTMLSNCKKHRVSKGRRVKGVPMPLGVRYDKFRKKYYAVYRPCGHQESITLSYWDTHFEAFEEYKKHKQADVIVMADKYKDLIPEKVYEALVNLEIKPYTEEYLRQQYEKSA